MSLMTTDLITTDLMTTDLLWRSLITAFSGEFSNATQAQAEPQWFVSTFLWQRPVPHLAPLLAPEIPQSLVFFLEQAPNLHRDRPYRQRLFHLGKNPTTGEYWGQYYQLLEYANWTGAAQDQERLHQLTSQDCQLLPGCRLNLTLIETQPNETQPNETQPNETQSNQANQERSFQATLPENQLCSFEYNQQTRYISVGFDLVIAPSGSVTLFSKDKGVDPETGRGLWGALMAPYRYEKVTDYPI